MSSCFSFELNLNWSRGIGRLSPISPIPICTTCLSREYCSPTYSCSARPYSCTLNSCTVRSCARTPSRGCVQSRRGARAASDCVQAMSRFPSAWASYGLDLLLIYLVNWCSSKSGPLLRAFLCILPSPVSNALELSGLEKAPPMGPQRPGHFKRLLFYKRMTQVLWVNLTTGPGHIKRSQFAFWKQIQGCFSLIRIPFAQWIETSLFLQRGSKHRMAMGTRSLSPFDALQFNPARIYWTLASHCQRGGDAAVDPTVAQPSRSFRGGDRHS